jgi:hypothetical protein
MIKKMELTLASGKRVRGYFSPSRRPVKKTPYRYSLRHDENDSNRIASIHLGMVIVRYYGTFQAIEPIDLYRHGGEKITDIKEQIKGEWG